MYYNDIHVSYKKQPTVVNKGLQNTCSSAYCNIIFNFTEVLLQAYEDVSWIISIKALIVIIVNYFSTNSFYYCGQHVYVLFYFTRQLKAFDIRIRKQSGCSNAKKQINVVYVAYYFT